MNSKEDTLKTLVPMTPKNSASILQSDKENDDSKSIWN